MRGESIIWMKFRAELRRAKKKKKMEMFVILYFRFLSRFNNISQLSSTCLPQYKHYFSFFMAKFYGNSNSMELPWFIRIFQILVSQSSTKSNTKWDLIFNDSNCFYPHVSHRQAGRGWRFLFSFYLQ